MKGAVVITLLVLAGAIDCPTYDCNSELPANQCIGYNQTASSFSLQSCPSGKFCPFTQQRNSTCEPEPMIELYPGDYCANNAYCITGICDKGICSNPISAFNCTEFVYQCSPGQFCNISSFLCEPQRTLGESCISTYDCLNDMTCQNNECVTYLSLPNGTPVDDVNDENTGLTLACISGFAAYNAAADSYTCQPAPTSSKVLPVSCHNNDTLCADSTGTYQSTCTCGYNTDGNSYCPLFPGDQIVIDVLKQLKQVLLFNQACNTYSRFRFTCFAGQSAANREIFNQFQASFTLVTEGLYPLTQNNPVCAEEVYLSSYTAQKQIASANLTDSCISYSCIESSDQWYPDQCLFYSIDVDGFQYSEPSIYLSGCTNITERCVGENYMNSSCEVPMATGYPGDFCTSHMDCVSEVCGANMCQGQLLYENCSDIYDCNPGAYCDLETQNCTLQKGSGDECMVEYECENYMTCNLGVCTKYFTLPNGAQTDQINGDGIALACESGFAFEGSCTVPVTSTLPIGYSCTPGTLCPSSNPSVSKPCTCAYSSTGASYCPLFLGDPIPQQAIAKVIVTQLRELVAFNYGCGTYTRFSEGCFLRTNAAWGPYYAYKSLMLNYTMFALMQEPLECLNTTLAVEYYQSAQKAAYFNQTAPVPDKDEHPDSGVTQSIFAALFLMSVFQ